jgi:hypothetical protein
VVEVLDATGVLSLLELPEVGRDHLPGDMGAGDAGDQLRLDMAGAAEPVDHREGGFGLADLEAVVVRIPAGVGRAITPAAFDGIEVEGKAVLVQTGWDVHWRTDRYLSGHPFLTEAAAQHLLDRGVLLAGIDSLNIDDTDDPARPVHSALLGNEVPIVEHMCNLRSLPDAGFRLYAVPAKVAGFGTWPVRVFAHVVPSD